MKAVNEVDVEDDNDVTHEVFFGENIKRIFKIFRKREVITNCQQKIPSDLFEYKYLDSNIDFNSPLDLQTLYRIKTSFLLHSDNSATCYGFMSLLEMIRKEEQRVDILPKISNQIKIDGSTTTLTDTSH